MLPMFKEMATKIMADVELSTPIRPYKYKIEQTARGARCTVHSDVLEEAVLEYKKLRNGLQAAGFRIAPED